MDHDPDSPSTLRSPTQSEAIAAQLAADVLEAPKHIAQYERSLVAVVIVVARQRPESPGLASRAAQVVRCLLDDTDGEVFDEVPKGEVVEMAPTPSGSWRAA